MIRTTIFALLAGTVMATATFAQDATPPAGDTPERPHPILQFDADGDGQVTLQEAQAAARENPLARADADGDGTVTRDEAIAMAVERASARASDRTGAMFDRLDEDSNGEIAVENLPQPRGDRGDRVEKMFERADANEDGVLSADEIAELPAKMMRDGRGHGRGHGDGRGHGGDRG